MSIFSDEQTLCEPEDNRCKRRKKCQRHIGFNPEVKGWIATYFIEFGQDCPYFLERKTDAKKIEG